MNIPDKITKAPGAANATWRFRVYEFIDGHHMVGRLRTPVLLEAALVAVILLNTLGLILWTVPHLEANYDAWFRLAETLTVTIFAIEYAVRFWAAPEADPSARPWAQRWRHVRSTASLIDATALMPSLLALAIMFLWDGHSHSLSALLAIRLLTRSLKLARYMPGAQRVGTALRRKGSQLIAAVATLMVVLVIAATLMYFAEGHAQPEVFSSIPSTMWWSVVTLTTVGYGDTVPVTAIGRLLAAVIAIVGIGLFALPAGILSAAMMEANEEDRQPSCCPHCGKEIT